MKVALVSLFFLALASCFEEQVVSGDRHITQNSDNILVVRKDPVARVDAVDRILYNLDEFEKTDPNFIHELETETLSRRDLEELVEASLGSSWSQMVVLPAEELSLIEALRLTTTLNEINIEDVEARRARETRNKGGNQGPNTLSVNSWAAEDMVCFCHGTASALGSKAARFSKDYPFKGIKMWKKIGVPFGHSNQHNDNPYDNSPNLDYVYRDCLIGVSSNLYDGRTCCSGFCAITGNDDPKFEVEDGLDKEVGLDWYCDYEDVTYGSDNKWKCGSTNCYTDTCPCEDLLEAINEDNDFRSGPCPCDADFIGVCDCDEILQGLFDKDDTGCDCSARNEIIDVLVQIEGYECACEQAVILNDNCNDCVDTINDIFQLDSDTDGCCQDFINYIDVRDQYPLLDDTKHDACTCEQAYDGLNCSCCESFEFMEATPRDSQSTAYGTDDNTNACLPWSDSQSHAAWIAGNCACENEAK